MTPADFRRIALSLEGAEEGSHMGSADFRVAGRIFATLASEKQGYGNLMLTSEQQLAFVEERPDLFVPVTGGWGRMGMTHVRLGDANEEILEGALRTAWKLRVEKNRKTLQKSVPPPPVASERRFANSRSSCWATGNASPAGCTTRPSFYIARSIRLYRPHNPNLPEALKEAAANRLYKTPDW